MAEIRNYTLNFAGHVTLAAQTLVSAEIERSHG
jgi:hypothetical protein